MALTEGDRIGKHFVISITFDLIFEGTKCVCIIVCVAMVAIGEVQYHVTRVSLLHILLCHWAVVHESCST